MWLFLIYEPIFECGSAWGIPLRAPAVQLSSGPTPASRGGDGPSQCPTAHHYLIFGTYSCCPLGAPHDPVVEGPSDLPACRPEPRIIRNSHERPGPARDGYAQRLKSLTALPLIVKGVLRADDAIATIDACKATGSTFLFLPT